ncbi:MAG TPA: hypothetical protein VH559_03210 [Gemmatimonadaceae bacterium]|jgi:hypothetical protein
MRIAAMAALVGSLCVAACNDSDNLNFVTPLGTPGTYTLVLVNGQALPAILTTTVSPPVTTTALSGQIVINADNTFSSVVALQNNVGGIISTSTRACSGTWTSTGSRTGVTITFIETATTNCGLTFTGVLGSVNTLTTSILGVPATFRR